MKEEGGGGMRARDPENGGNGTFSIFISSRNEEHRLTASLYAARAKKVFFLYLRTFASYS
jgi:hypothetical protein